MDKADFDTLIQNRRVALFTLQNSNGMAVQITNFGARIVSLWVPSRDGSFKDVVWGYETIRGYLEATDVFSGPVVGRFGNRIKNGQFSLDGTAHQLTRNNNGNHLHGGSDGFWNKVWTPKLYQNDQGADVLELEYQSPQGEEGYPANLQVKVVYTLLPGNELRIDYFAETDAPTIVNLTSHAYFNLHGTSAKSTNSHLLHIAADFYTPTDSLLIPTGEIKSIRQTPLDFTTSTPIGERIDSAHIDLKYGKGYDHNWVLNKPAKTVGVAAEVYEPETGIFMTVTTDQTGIQFYSGNFMNGVDIGKYGEKHDFRTGIALETQNFPDAPNHPSFPSSVLRQGEVYRQVCTYGFQVK